MKLIDPDELERVLRPILTDESCPLHIAAEIDMNLDLMPKVDAVPVRRGRWKCADDLYENAVCSVCGWETSDPWTVIKILYKFCPNCGADMRKDGGDE